MKFLALTAFFSLLTCSNAFALSLETYQVKGNNSSGNYWRFEAKGENSGIVELLPGAKEVAVYLQNLESEKKYSCSLEAYRAIVNHQMVLMVFGIQDCK